MKTPMQASTTAPTISSNWKTPKIDRFIVLSVPGSAVLASRSTSSASTNCAACAARLLVIHSTAAPRSRAARMACAIGTARSGMFERLVVHHDQVGLASRPRTQAARTRARLGGRLAAPGWQAGRPNAGLFRWVAIDHPVARPVEMVGAGQQHRVEHGHVGRPDVALDDGADAAAAVHALARRASSSRRQELHLAGRVGQPMLRSTRRRVGVVIDSTSATRRRPSDRRGRELALGKVTPRNDKTERWGGAPWSASRHVRHEVEQVVDLEDGDRRTHEAAWRPGAVSRPFVPPGTARWRSTQVGP